MTVDLPILRKGDTGTDVARMQGLLVAAGWMAAPLTGIWDAVTETAKLGFDAAVGLGDPNDSSCGAKSWESLLTGRKW